MAKIISKAQKTFVDLYDSYVLNMSSDVVAVPCDQYGVATSKYTTTITFSANVGTKQVDSKCELLSTSPSGVSISINNTSDMITITVAQGAKLSDDLRVGVKITTTDANAFVFEKYITFIKVKTGADGKDGEQIVTFKIYSEDGDTFREGLEEITMETVAFDGLTQIANATYAWSYYDLNTSKWVKITADQGNNSTLGSYLTIAKTDKYATSVFKCTMTYNSKTYEDCFTLKIINHSYDVVVKFFDGSNIFDASEPFIVAYLELYKDQQEEEMIKTYNYYYHTGNTYDASTGIHTFNPTGIDSCYNVTGTLMYIIYKVENSSDDTCAKYKTRLCRYTGSGWAGASTTTYANKYVYKTDLYDVSYESAEATNVFIISKEDVSKHKDINFTVYTKATDGDGNFVYDNDLIVARNHVTVIDLNDPVISATEPSNPKDGQLWLDTSKIPYTLYIYENGEWVYFTQQNGKTVYTSKPSSYSEGDLWILAPGEICGSFSEGTMLRAKQSSSTFSSSHWEDAMSTLTEMYNNIEQTFTFNKYNYVYNGKLPGLTIGQTNDAFYVNINSEKMGFYDNSDGQNKEVVYISNESANIDGLTVETNLDVECNTTFNKDYNIQFGNFVWKVEQNGSLSLAIET